MSDAGVAADSGQGTDSGCSSTGTPTDVLTYHNDNARTGQYLTETCLSSATLNASNFGKLFVQSVDGKVDAQPLYVHGVSVQGKGTHNVLLVATEHDSVYAFDADTATGANAAPLWKTSMLGVGERPSGVQYNCTQVTPEIGVTSTPVVDPSTNILYLVAVSQGDGGTYHQRFHALDITSGVERAGGPTEIRGSYPGIGDNSDGGFVIFDPGQYVERSALTLLPNGQVYLAFSSHCDVRPYTGFVMAYDKTTLLQTAIVDLTANGNEGSVWMAGSGLAADSSNNLYLLTANGSFEETLDANGFPINHDFGNAFVKLSTTGAGLAVADYFTMLNSIIETGSDEDLGSGGVILLPDVVGSPGHRHLCVGAGKDTHCYLVDRDNMGHFSPTSNNIVQDLPGVLGTQPPGGCFSVPAYYNGAIFYGSMGRPLLRFSIANAQISAPASSQTTATFSYPGAFPSISSDGPASPNALVWVVESSESLSTAILHAYLASDVSVELYNSNLAGNRDQFGPGNKFVVPTIANGKVYVGTTNGVGVFGLR